MSGFFTGLIGILAFVFVLLFSVMVHEAGHFFTARMYGMKVTEFFLGFGKRIWSTQRGETEFGVKAIPAGGYCRIVGMTATEEIDPADSNRAFVKASVPKKLVVLGAGSTLHFLLGLLALFILLVGPGVNTMTATVQSVAECITVSTESCAADALPSPAKVAGIQSGDTIVGIDGQRISEWGAVVKRIRASAGTPIQLLVERNGEVRTVEITPAVRMEGKTKVGVLGVFNKVGTHRDNPLVALKNATLLTKDLSYASIQGLIALPAKVPQLFRQTFGNEKRDPNGLVGVVGVARASAETATSSSLTLSDKIRQFLIITAGLNIFVGIFNFLPLLPLDGGHMAIALIDGLRNRWARIRKRPMPEPINIERLTPFTALVFVILVTLSVILLLADIINPVHLNP